MFSSVIFNFHPPNNRRANPIRTLPWVIVPYENKGSLVKSQGQQSFITGFSLTHIFVRFDAIFDQMTRKINFVASHWTQNDRQRKHRTGGEVSTILGTKLGPNRRGGKFVDGFSIFGCNYIESLLFIGK